VVVIPTNKPIGTQGTTTILVYLTIDEKFAAITADIKHSMGARSADSGRVLASIESSEAVSRLLDAEKIPPQTGVERQTTTKK